MVKWVVWITVFVVLWVGFFRPFLRKRPGAQWFFRLTPVEWIELHVYKKSESIAWSRYLTVLGTALTMIANMDPASAQMYVQMFSPLLPESLQSLATFIPMVITLAGLFSEWQRRDTSKPLEVVALPSDAPADVTAAVDAADAANRVAEAKVVEFKKAA